MPSKIKFKSPYQHSYDYYYDQVKDNVLFNQDTWKKAADTGSLDSYVVELSEIGNKVDIDSFSKEYGLDYLSQDEIRMAMQNEVYKDNLSQMIKDDAIRYKTDENGEYIFENGKPVEEKYETNLYDYNKALLQNQAKFKIEQNEKKALEDYKESLSPFAKWLAGAAINMGNFGLSAVRQFENVLTFFYALGGGAIESIFDEEKGTFADSVVKRAASDDTRFISKKIDEKTYEETGYESIDEAIFDVERVLTDNRDLEGNYNNFWEELTASIWQTTGQMVPSLITSGVAGMLGAGKTATSFIGNGLFYSGVTAGDIKDTYDYFAENNISVSNAAILTNSVIKSALQLGVELLLGKFFGGASGLDVATKGGIAKGATKSGLKRFFGDALQEGLEELLQEFTDNIVNDTYEYLVEENFGDLSELTLEGIALSFLAGAIMSMGSNTIEILSTGKITTDEILKGSDIPKNNFDIKKGQVPVLNKEGIVVDKNTGEQIKYKKLSKIASWNYNMNLRTYIESLNKLTELDAKFKNEGKAFAPGTTVHREYIDAVKNAYESVRVLGTIYKTVGQEEFEKAMNLLDMMNKSMVRGAYVSGFGEMVKENFETTLSGLSAKSKAKLMEKILAAHMDQIDKVIDKDKLEDIEYDEQTKEKLRKFFKNYNRVILSKNGNKTIVDEESGTIFIPTKQFKNNSYESIQQQINEDNIVETISNNYIALGIDTKFVKNLETLYEEQFGEKADKNTIFFRLLYDNVFRDVVIRTDNTAYYNFEKLLNNIEKIKLKDKYKTDKDKLFAEKLLEKKLNIIKNSFKITMINYIIDNPSIRNTIDNKLYDKAELDFIKSSTESRVLVEQYVNTGKITEKYLNNLKNKINNAILTIKQKEALETILTNKKSTKQQREFLINILDESYNYYYKGKKNNVIYLKENGDFKRVLFNKFLESNTITLKNLYNDDIDFIVRDFEVFTGNMFSFELSNDINNPVIIFDNRVKTDKSAEFAHYKTLISGTNIIVLSENKNVINKFVNKDYNNLTVNDLIMDRRLLNNTTKDEIVKMFNLESYDEITPEHIVNYLNKKLEIDKMQISIDVDGNFVLVDFHVMEDVFNKTDFSLDYLKNLLGGYLSGKKGSRVTRALKISDKKLNLIKTNFLQHFDNDNVTIMIAENDNVNTRGVFDTDTKTIILFDNNVTSNENAFFTFAHEFQHMISYYNSLSNGGKPFLDNLSVKDAVEFIKLLEKEQLVEKIGYKDVDLKNVIKNNSFEQLESSNSPINKYVHNIFYNLYKSIQGEVDANSLVNTMLPFNIFEDGDRRYINTPFNKSFELVESRFPNETYTEVKTNNSQLVSYDISNNNEKPLTERQKKAQEAKLKKPIEYKPGKFKIARVDKYGNIIRDENGRIKYDYKQKTYETRYTGKKESAGTNLQKYGYVGKNLKKDFKSFIVKATPDIDRDIWNKLINSKLTRNYVLKRIREGNLDNKTFALINDCFFQNTDIKTVEELETYVELSSEYAALYYTLKNTNLLNEFGNKITKDNIKEVIRIISEDENLSALYNKFSKNFNKSWGKELDIDKGTLRYNWLKLYDGTIFSAGHIANIARRTAIQTHYITNKTVSLGSSITGTDLTIEDTLRDDSAQDAFEEIVNSLSETQEFEALKRIIILQSQKKAEKEDANKDEVYKETKQKLARLQTIYDETPEKIHNMFIVQTSKMTTEQKHKLLVGTIIEENLDRKLKENEEKRLEELSKKFAEKYDRTVRHIINNVNRTSVTISNRLTSNEKRRFLDKNKDLFHSVNNKIVLKEDWYKDKSKQELEQIEQRVRDISAEVKAGAWHSAREYKEFKKLQTEIEKLRNELINEKLKTKRKVVTISDENIIVNTSVEMPSKLKEILNNTFDKYAKTNVQEVSLEDSKHITENYYSFIENNAKILNNLTIEDIEAIIDFYLSSEVLPETNKVRQYLATRLFLSTYIIKSSEEGRFAIDQDKINKLTDSMESMVSIGAQIPAMWKSSLKTIRETRQMLIRGLGNEMMNIVFEKDTIQNLTNAVDSGDYEKIKIARKKMYDEGLKKLQQEKKNVRKDLKYYLETFIQFERTAMLSGPGTWVRNQISNVIIGGLRTPTEKLGDLTSKVLQKIFPKKFKKAENQYKIISTKVSTKVQSFIKKELIDSGLLKLISNGLSKQSTADIDYSYKVDNVVDLIKQGIKNDIRSKARYNSELINNMFNLVYKMMSDDKAVNKTMLLYFGKMLTEKNINLDKGMSNDVIKILVDAYTFAASEFMHKTNLITQFENWLKNKSYKYYFMYKQLFPFAASSWNWFKEGLNYTPYGLAKAIIDFAKLENTIYKLDKEGNVSSELAQYITIKNIGKGVIGSIGTIIGALLAIFGIARIDEEDDKYKLFVGNTAIDISDIFGTQSIMISMTIVSSIKNKDDLMNVLTTSLDAIFADSTFQDTINLFRYSDGSGDFLMYLPEKILRAMLPNFFKQIASIINVKEVKYSRGIVGRIERLAVQSIPGIAYLLPHYIDPYTGEEQITYNVPILTNLINKLTPLNIYPYRVSDTEKEAISLGVGKGMLSGEYIINNEDVTLNASQRKKLNEYYGKLNKADLEDLMDNKTKYKVQNEQGTYDDLYYKEMTDKQKATVIDRIMSNNSGYAKTYILTQELGYKYYTTASERETLRNLGITKNIYVKNKKYYGYVK